MVNSFGIKSLGILIFFFLVWRFLMFTSIFNNLIYFVVRNVFSIEKYNILDLLDGEGNGKFYFYLEIVYIFKI